MVQFGKSFALVRIFLTACLVLLSCKPSLQRVFLCCSSVRLRLHLKAVLWMWAVACGYEIVVLVSLLCYMQQARIFSCLTELSIEGVPRINIAFYCFLWKTCLCFDCDEVDDEAYAVLHARAHASCSTPALFSDDISSAATDRILVIFWYFH